MVKFILTLTVGSFFILLTGCYTQLMVVDTSPPPAETEEWVIDSATGDTVKVIRQVDTIEVDDGRTCVWERDLMGYPRLRCYSGFYPSDWYYSNYSPWWYRNDPYYYDYRRCPRYYYYDPSCGCCRYTSYDYHYRHYNRDDNGEPSGRRPSGTSGSSFRSRGVPDGRATGSSGSSRSGTSTRRATTGSSTTNTPDDITVTDEKTNKKTIIRRRSRGVPGASSGARSSSGKKSTRSSSTQNSTPPPASPPSTTTSPSSSGSSSPPPPPPQQNRSNDDRPKRRKSRSW